MNALILYVKILINKENNLLELHTYFIQPGRSEYNFSEDNFFKYSIKHSHVIAAKYTEAITTLGRRSKVMKGLHLNDFCLSKPMKLTLFKTHTFKQMKPKQEVLKTLL